MTMTRAKSSAALMAADTGRFTLGLPSKQEVAEVFAENMGGIPLQCEVVKIPSGGGVTWEITDDDGNVDTAKEIVGIIINHHPMNGYWRDEFSGKSQPPDCFSVDGVVSTGINIGGIVYKDCASCPLNQFGSAQGGGAGKACKNMHRIYLLREGTVLPLIINLPPTSLTAIGDYVRRLTNKLKRLSGIVTRIALEKDKNEGGIQYSKATFSSVGELSREEAQKIAEYARALKPFLRQISADNLSTGAVMATKAHGTFEDDGGAW